MRRRELLASTAFFLAGGIAARAQVLSGALPWRPDAGSPPPRIGPDWLFFTPREATAVEALADRIIPPDPETPGGKDAGCAVFIDRQLAGAYGRQEGLYTRPPFRKGSPQQGPQSAEGPAAQYRAALAALDRWAQKTKGGKRFVDLTPAEQDGALEGLEKGSIELDGGVDARQFFELLLKDVQDGFFADPIYGGNRDMVAWKMIGFPGTRYNWLDWVGRHNQKVDLPPVSLAGAVQWTPGG